MVCHEIRQVYHLPLRQCQGFIDSLFFMNNIPLKAPDFSCLSKRLAALGLKSPGYKKTDKPDETVSAIAIDSTGLKRFGKDEWHQEKHNIAAKRSWRKLHIAVDEGHFIQAAILTERSVADEKVVEDLLNQIECDVDHLSADGAYDKHEVYNLIEAKYPNAKIAIPPRCDAVLDVKHHQKRNDNLSEIKESGRMAWQKSIEYGRHNLSELCIQRYKRILGNALRARSMSCQKNEAMIGCGVLNKMTGLGMPKSYRVT